MKKLVAILLFTLASPLFAAKETSILIALEEPMPGDIKSGITNLRGWAVTPWSESPIVKIQLFHNGVYRFDIPYGAPRSDVCNSHRVPNCASSGFSMSYNYNNLAPGSHTLTVRAVDLYGNYNDASSRFSVTRFHDAYIRDSDSIDFAASKVSLPSAQSGNIHDKRIYLENVFVSGRCYDLILNWYTPIQGWRSENVVEIHKDYCE